MSTPRLNAIRALVCLFVLLSPGLTDFSAAQDGGVLRPRGGEILSDDPLSQFRQRLQERTAAGAGIPMEGAVDADEYVVGPGDVFTVSVGGPQPMSAAVPVSADGRLILPEGIVVPAAGRLLADVRRDALDALARSYRNVSLDVSLAQPRQFYVHVAGAVPVAGRYLALPVARVSDVLQLAFADTTRPPVTNSAYRPSLRNIQLTRRDGSSGSADLALYFSTGRTEANPYVRDGDVIKVGAYSLTSSAIFVNGAVPFPGTYDYRPGDTVVEVLRMSGATADFAGIGSVRVARQQPDGTLRTWTYTTDELLQGSVDVPIQPLDHVSAEAARPAAGTAEVEGYVRYPGTYAIEPGSTTLKDLIELAGGLRKDALIDGAYLLRDVLPHPEVPMSRPNRYERQVFDIAELRPDTVAIMRYLRQSDLDFLSRTQFAQGLRIQNRVSMDLAAALEPDAAPVYLQDEDRLVVPRDENSVFVFGQVQRPGYVPYETGRTLSHYIALAGGTNDLAQRTYLVEAGSGRYLDARSEAIGSGDLIFVDSRQDVADSAELQRLVLEESRARAATRTQWFQVVTQTVFGLASVLSLYLSLRN